MPHGKDLCEVGTVGIAVQVDLGDVERVQDRRQIVGREDCAVEGRPPAQRRAAGADRSDGPACAGLQLMAVDRIRSTCAAIVHEQHILVGQQRSEQGEVVVTRPGGRITGSALGGDQGPARGTRIRMRIKLEMNAHLAANPAGGVQRTPQSTTIRMAAPRQVDRADPPVRFNGVGPGGGERRRAAHQEGEDRRQRRSRDSPDSRSKKSMAALARHASMLSCTGRTGVYIDEGVASS
jgi:hypothetical protein